MDLAISYNTVNQSGAYMDLEREGHGFYSQGAALSWPSAIDLVLIRLQILHRASNRHMIRGCLNAQACR